MNKEDLALIRAAIKKYGRISRAWVMMKFKVNLDQANIICARYNPKRISD